jgi:HK97 family phage major capsid protein
MSNYQKSAAELRLEVASVESRMLSLAGRGKSVQRAAANRELTDGEQRSLDKILAEFDQAETGLRALRADLAEAEEREDPMRQSAGRQVQPSPLNYVRPDPIGHRPGHHVSAPGAAALPAPGTRPTFAALFRNAVDPYGGAFRSFGEFCRVVASGGHDARLLRNAMSEGVGQSGGFLVPGPFLGAILDGALALEVVRPGALVVPMESKTATVGSFDYADGTSSARAGLTLRWSAEGSSLAEQTGRTREFTLAAHKGAIFVRVSNELAGDAPNFDRQLTAAMAAAVAAGLDAAFLAGTGAGQPLGILNAPCTISVAAEGGQAADTVSLTNVSKMAARLEPASYRNSVWLAHPTVLPQLYQLAVVIRNVANTENVGGSAAGITSNADGSLSIYGRPVLITESCAPVGDVGDLILADLSKYVVGLRADASIAIDGSRYFDTDELAFRLIVRVDGQPMHAAPRKLRDGTNTVSPFVTLAAR